MQKITPFLWFGKNNAEEAMNFYVSLFPNSKIISIKRYPSGIHEGPMAGFDGKVLTGVFEIAGFRLMGLDGGPIFSFNPTVSISVQCDSETEIDELYAKLKEGGSDLMPLANYGFSEKYAWVNDKFGLSWQLNFDKKHEAGTKKIAPFMMFHGAKNGKAEEAMTYYTSVFPDSSVVRVWKYDSAEQGGTPGTIAHALFNLCDTEMMVSDGGTKHAFDNVGAVSFLIECKDQAEIDHYWSKLSAVPEAEQCGWCKDKFGFTWQVTPDMSQWIAGSDSAGAGRAMQAMLQMKKIDIASLEKAYRGE